MKLKLTTDEIRRLKRTPPATVVDYYDTKQPGLVLRCRPSGAHTYRALLGRGRWHTLGALKDLELDEARTLALGQEDPVAARQARRTVLTFAAFVEKHYAPWALEHKRSAVKTLESVDATLIPAFGTMKLTEITPFAVEQWRTRRRRDDNVSASTINRNLDDLKSMLGKAAAWELVAANPVAAVKRLRIDRTGVVRFLEPAEEQRLLAALVARDARQRQSREQSNAWRRARNYQEWPALGTYADHLHPFVLLLLHTGIRRGEAFELRWQDVDLARAMLTIRGETAKSGQSRVIPLNTTAAGALQAWRAQRPADTGADRVFASAVSGEALTTIKTGWMAVLKAANVTGFRLHDCRHHFASQLVMRGVDLVTVSRLLGHSDVRMTMRYSHLAPDHLAAAVAKLVSA
jgi:integrase